MHDMHDMHDFKSSNIPHCPWPGRNCPHTDLLGHKILGGGAVIAHDLLKRAAASGVELGLAGDALKVWGCREAVEMLLPELRAHKAEIVELLARNRMTAIRDSAAPELESQPSATPLMPPKLNYLSWQESWIEFDRAYQHHHLNCPVCIAAGKGYGLRCGTGAALYTAYFDASADWSRLNW